MPSNSKFLSYHSVATVRDLIEDLIDVLDDISPCIDDVSSINDDIASVRSSILHLYDSIYLYHTCHVLWRQNKERNKS